MNYPCLRNIEFVSLNTTNQILWNTTQTLHSIYHQIQRSILVPLTENQEMSEDGILYFATEAVGFTFVSDPDRNVNNQYI